MELHFTLQIIIENNTKNAVFSNSATVYDLPTFDIKLGRSKLKRLKDAHGFQHIFFVHFIVDCAVVIFGYFSLTLNNTVFKRD